MMVRNPRGQKLPAASHGQARTWRAEAVELLWARGQCGEGAQPPPQPRAPGPCMALQHQQENQPGSPSPVSPSFSKCTSLPGQQIHPRLAAGREKFSGVLAPVSCGWRASLIPQQPGCASACRAKGILPRAFSWLFFFPPLM